MLCWYTFNIHHQDGREIKPWNGKVFLVHLNDEMVVYNWRWEYADITDFELPENYEDRFRERVL